MTENFILNSELIMGFKSNNQAFCFSYKELVLKLITKVAERIKMKPEFLLSTFKNNSPVVLDLFPSSIVSPLNLD